MSAIERPLHTPDLMGKKRWRRIVPVFLWMVFIAGLSIQVFGPRLKIENHAFIMRPSLTSQNGDINPGAIVDREREVQWTSGILTLGSAISLAFWYRRRLAGALMPGRSFDQQGR